MEAFVSRYYSRKFNIPESELMVKASRNPFPRTDGLTAENNKGIIPANPLMHIDYISEDAAYQTQTGRDKKFHEENDIDIITDNDFFSRPEIIL